MLISSGRVVTNYHVVKGGFSYQVGQGKQMFPATIYGYDEKKDICLLDANDIKAIPAEIGKAIDLKVGDPVYAVGAPKGLELSLSDGVVSQLRGEPPSIIQTTAAISPGSSGGGLFDGEGLLVGLTTLQMVEGQNLNFAMPVEWISEIQPGRIQTIGGNSDDKWVKRSIELEQMKDWQGMLEWDKKWTKSEPASGGAWFCLGLSYYRLHRYNDATEAYQQSLRINPDIAEVWKGLGCTYSGLKRYKDAIQAHLQALRIDPDDADTWILLGIAYSNLKRNNDAIQAYIQAVRIKPDFVNAWHLIGVAYDSSGNRTAALDVVRELRRFDPSRADDLFNFIIQP